VVFEGKNEFDSWLMPATPINGRRTCAEKRRRQGRVIANGKKQDHVFHRTPHEFGTYFGLNMNGMTAKCARIVMPPHIQVNRQ
jgi:hypothetical protein